MEPAKEHEFNYFNYEYNKSLFDLFLVKLYKCFIKGKIKVIITLLKNMYLKDGHALCMCVYKYIVVMF